MRSFLFVALVGCSTPATITFDDLDAALIQARCTRLATCGAFPDAATCTAYFRARPDRDLAKAVDVAKVRYDGELAALCIDALANQACDATVRETRRLPQACDRMFLGTLAEGAACEFDRECASDACTPNEPCQVGQCCPGTCDAIASKAADTEACLTTPDCATDLYCGIDHLCHPLELAGGDCFVDATCDYGLRCNTTTRTCVVAAATGDACPDDACADLDARCIAGACKQVAIGDACTDGAQCGDFMQCDGTHCVAEPMLGQPCTGFCAGEAWCDASTSTCTALKANGTPCNAASECESYFCEEGAAFDMCATAPVCS